MLEVRSAAVPKKRIKLMPLGGLGEIGMNCLVLEWQEQILLIDCGIQFPDANYPGVELLTPDLSYVVERISGLQGVVVTHGHDDHIGAIPFLAKETDLDVYCTPFPKGLLLKKLEEHTDACEIRFHEIEPSKVFQVGAFKIEPIKVQHSIIESLALSIETPAGKIIHTGDFKHDPDEVKGEVIGFERFRELGDEGILLLLSDSTNAERSGHTITENQVLQSFTKLFLEQSGRLFIALFASNIRRIENLLWECHRQGKKVGFAGRSMHSYTHLAHQQKSLNLPPDTLHLLEELGQFPEDKTIVLLTGSQAEPQSALVRIANGTHKDLRIKSGDKIILSSRFIPGNEKAISSMIDHLYRSGAEVIYEAVHKIHVSGHGFQDELLMMLKSVKPRFFIPIHGEYRHLAKHAQLAKSAGVESKNVCIIENGQSLELSEAHLKHGEKIPLQKGIIVSNAFMQTDPEIFVIRNQLARTGIVFVTLMRNAKSKKLVHPPAIACHGLLLQRHEEIQETLNDAVDLVEGIYPGLSKDPDWEKTLKLEVRRFFKRRACHKPTVLTMMLEV
jgi:ribonuclease J